LVSEWLGAKPLNHSKDFYEGIRIKALFFKGQCEFCVVCEEGGLKEVLGDFYGIHNLCKMGGQWRIVYILCV
jgi:hypothetical protein